MADRQRVLTFAGLGLVAAGLVMAMGKGSSSSSGSGSTTTGSPPTPFNYLNPTLPLPVGSLWNPSGRYPGDLSQAWVMGADGKIHPIPSFAVYQACHFPPQPPSGNGAGNPANDPGVCHPIAPSLFAKVPLGAAVSAPQCWPPVCGPAAANQRAGFHLPAPSKTDCPGG